MPDQGDHAAPCEARAAVRRTLVPVVAALATVVLIAALSRDPRPPADATTILTLLFVPAMVRFGPLIEGRTSTNSISAAPAVLFASERLGHQLILPFWAAAVLLGFLIAFGLRGGFGRAGLEITAAGATLGLAGLLDLPLPTVVWGLLLTGMHPTLCSLLHAALDAGRGARPALVGARVSELALLWFGALAAYLLVAFLLADHSDRARDQLTTAFFTLSLITTSQAIINRLQLRRRAVDTLESAAIAMPWPAAEIDDRLREYAGHAVRAPYVEITRERPETGLAVPLRGRRFLVAARQRGDLPFLPSDARLLRSLGDMAEVSRTHALHDSMLRREASTDQLTGLLFYSRFEQRLLERAADRPPGQRIAVIFADLDDFKLLNTRIGHLAADQVLATIGERLRERLPDDVVAARFGGDEFVFLADDRTADLDVRDLIGTIHGAVADPISVGGWMVRVLPSLGVALSSDADEAPDQIVARAETQMRQRKLSTHTPDLQDARQVIERMLDRDEVTVAYQPIVDPQTGKLYAVEALLRGSDGSFGPLPPLLVVDSASRTRMLDRVTLNVATQAIQEVSRAAELRRAPMTLSFNVEVEQLDDDGPLIHQLLDLAAGAPDVRIVLEVSERSIRTWGAGQVATAARMRDAGIGFAVDDFGAGFATFAVLTRDSWDWVKVDQGIARARTVEERRLLSHVASMLHDLGRVSVAEGIETAEQADIVTRLGMTFMQGHWISRPLPGPDMIDLAASGRRLLAPAPPPGLSAVRR